MFWVRFVSVNTAVKNTKLNKASLWNNPYHYHNEKNKIVNLTAV